MEAEAKTCGAKGCREETCQKEGTPTERGIREGTSDKVKTVDKGYHAMEGKCRTVREEATKCQAVYHVASTIE